MNKNIKKVESVKKPRFAVLDGTEQVIATNKKEEANEKWIQLQQESKSLIVFLDHKEKYSLHVTKTIHQKNYRMVAGDYEIDTALPTVAEVPQTEA